MEFFTKSSTVRLRSHLDKHLASSPDHLGIRQSRRPTRHTLWRVEPVPDQPALIRLKNLHTQKYLTASASAILLGVVGKRVIQTPNPHSSPATCWEPVRDGFQVKLRSAGGTFLRANGGAAPWRNSVTHDSGSSRGVKGWVLWDVESVEEDEVKEYLSSLSSFGSSALDDDEDGSQPVSPMSVISYESPSFFSFRRGSEHGGRVETKMEGRTVYYHIASDEYGEDGGDGNGGFAMLFGGTSVEELTRRLEEETGLEDIVVCTKSPLNQKLYPLRLQLPPNITMHVVVVPRDSEVARDLAKSGSVL